MAQTREKPRIEIGSMDDGHSAGPFFGLCFLTFSLLFLTLSFDNFFNLLNTHALREKQSQAAQAALVHRNSRPGGSRLFFSFSFDFLSFFITCQAHQ
jgi:hypothetical protein